MLVIKLPPSSQLSDEQFWELRGANPETHFERNPQGDLIIMSPTGVDTGNRNSNLTADFVIWNRRYNLMKELLSRFTSPIFENP